MPENASPAPASASGAAVGATETASGPPVARRCWTGFSVAPIGGIARGGTPSTSVGRLT